MNDISESKLIGYVRRTDSGNSLKLSIDVQAFNDAVRFATKDGAEFVQLVIGGDRIKDVLAGDREVTSVCQIVE